MSSFESEKTPDGRRWSIRLGKPIDAAIAVVIVVPVLHLLGVNPDLLRAVESLSSRESIVVTAKPNAPPPQQLQRLHDGAFLVASGAHGSHVVRHRSEPVRITCRSPSVRPALEAASCSP
jgi:hypothetical protein